MTTNCGSFTPVARETAVAAGIPMSVTAAAAMAVAQVRLAMGIWELASAQRMTVARDPHVPGPGLMRPMPKKVAMRVAQSGARDFAAVLGEEPVTFLSISVLVGDVLAHGSLAVGDWRGDHVSTAGPLAQVDLTAMVTAEREVGIGGLDGLFADRTAESYRAFGGHMRLRKSKVKLKKLKPLQRVGLTFAI